VCVTNEREQSAVSQHNSLCCFTTFSSLSLLNRLMAVYKDGTNIRRQQTHKIGIQTKGKLKTKQKPVCFNFRW